MELVAKGDFVKISFEGKADGVVFDKTAPGKSVLVPAGNGQLIAGLDEAIVGSALGEKKNVSIPPEKAFGQRNPEYVRLVPLSQFQQSGMTPVVGQVVELDGVKARVQSVSGGRVRVDFNHELAGKTLLYEFTVEAKFTDNAAKLDALVKDLLPGSSAKLDGTIATIVVPSSVRKDGNFVMSKARLLDTALNNGVASKAFVTEEYEAAKAQSA